MSAATILKLSGISKSFTADNGVALKVLDDFSLDVSEGEFVCILGSSGCGKSTILSIVAGFEKQDSGEATIHGKTISGAGTDRVLLFQDATLFPWLDVLGNVEFGLRAKGLKGKERREIAMDWIERVHLKGFEHSYAHQLSGGMRQRAAIARALAINPEFLLMDEPFCAVDAMTRDMLHEELEKIWSSTNKTIIFVTHNVRESVALGDRVVVLSPRPGKVSGIFKIDLPRPRSLEDTRVTAMTAEIMKALRGK